MSSLLRCEYFQFLSETKKHLQRSEQRDFCYAQNKNNMLKSVVKMFFDNLTLKGL